jgi:hypothetical protein
MKSLSIFLLFILPNTVFADCVLTDTPYKFEVVCSGYNPLSPPIASKKNTKTSKKVSSKSKKASIADREGITSAVGMTEEELKIMQARNKMDGYRGKVKHKEQTAKN